MKDIIIDLVKMQEGTLSNETILSYDQIMKMNLLNLSEMILEPNNENRSLIETVGATMDFGTINKRLTYSECRDVFRALGNIEDYNKLKNVLFLFEQLSNYLTPYLENHPIAREIKILDNMVILANEQDKKLADVITSIPTSSIVFTPNDDRKRELIRLYQKIQEFKTLVDEMFFKETICPEIELCAQNGYPLRSILSLFSYTISKTRTQANVDSDIRELYILCKMEMMPIVSKQKNEYLMVADTINASYEKYVDVVKSLKQYGHTRTKLI